MFGTSERLKCSSGRSFLFFRPATSSRAEEPLQDALNMVTETSGDASQDQDLLFYRRPVTGRSADCCLEKEKQESKEKQRWERLFRHISVAMTLSGLWKSFLGGNYLFWGSSDSRGTKQLCGTFLQRKFLFCNLNTPEVKALVLHPPPPHTHHPKSSPPSHQGYHQRGRLKHVNRRKQLCVSWIP